MRVNADTSARGFGAVNAPEGKSEKPSFSSVLEGTLRTSGSKSVSNTYGKEEALAYAKRTAGYADGLMKSFINDIGGPLIDISDPDAIRFSVSGELVTKEAMIYYSEMDRIAKQGYNEIYQEGKSRGESAEKTFERFLDFNSSLPLRYKQMANISF